MQISRRSAIAQKVFRAKVSKEATIPVSVLTIDTNQIPFYLPSVATVYPPRQMAHGFTRSENGEVVALICMRLAHATRELSAEL